MNVALVSCDYSGGETLSSQICNGGSVALSELMHT